MCGGAFLVTFTQDIRSSGTGANLSDTTLPVALPGDPDDLVIDYPEGSVPYCHKFCTQLISDDYSYNSTISGTSGNITVNGTLTFGAGLTPAALTKRSANTDSQAEINLNDPPYAIHNGQSSTACQLWTSNVPLWNR